MKKTILLMLFISLFLYGCKSNVNVSTAQDLIVSSVNFKYYYENGDFVNVILKADLNEDELNSLITSLDKIKDSKELLNSIANEPLNLILNLQTASKEYLNIRDSYIVIRSIVLDNKDDYNNDEWMTFVKFDQSALSLNRQFISFLEEANYESALVKALQMADLAYKVTEIL